MSRDNLFFILITFAAMGAGVLVPGIGQPLRHLPTASLIVQLLLSFLSTSAPGTSFSAKSVAGLPRFLLIRMLIVPVLCCALFAAFLPQYALGAMLLAGASVGVVAPFFTMQARGDAIFAVAAVIVSSLVLPLTMPVLTLGYFALAGQEVAGGLWMSFLRTGVALAIYIFLPFIAARLLWWKGQAAARGILRLRYILTVVGVGGSMFVIFSQYALPLRENPARVLEAFLAAILLGVIFIGVGMLSGLGRSTERKLSYVVSMGTGNNVLMVILSSQFFGLNEVLITAMYSIPLFGLLLPYTWYGDWLRKKEAAVPVIPPPAVSQ